MEKRTRRPQPAYLGRPPQRRRRPQAPVAERRMTTGRLVGCRTRGRGRSRPVPALRASSRLGEQLPRKTAACLTHVAQYSGRPIGAGASSSVFPARALWGMICDIVPPEERTPPPESSDSSSERHLVEDARRDSRSAINSLVERYRPWLRWWASGRLPPWVRGDIDTSDLVQDALQHTLARLPFFDSKHAGALRHAPSGRDQAGCAHSAVRRCRHQTSTSSFSTMRSGDGTAG